MPKVTIDIFDRAIQNDPRSVVNGAARFVTNFDVLTDPHRIRPYPSAESGDVSSGDQKIQNFAIGDKPATIGTFVIYGLGVVTGTDRANIFFKEVKIATSNDLADATWSVASGGADDTNDTKFDLFVYYKKTKKLYGARSGGQFIWSYDVDGVTFNKTEKDLGATNTNIGQGLVHSKDDIMYFPAGNVIWKNNNGVFTAALTLPEHFKVTSIAESGNNLLIACEPISGETPGFGGSALFVWDTTSTTWNERASWGDERLQVIGEINGVIVGISTATGVTWFDRRLVFKYLLGSQAIQFAELTSTSNFQTALISGLKQIHNNRLQFLFGMTINGTYRPGVWSVGGVPGNFTIMQERSLDNDTAFSIDTNLRSFIYVGDYLFQSYDITGTFSMSKTVDGATFNATSIWESAINPKMVLPDRAKNKQLKAVRLTVEKIGSGLSTGISLKYKVDGGSFIDVIQDFTTADTITIERNQDATSTEFTAGKEYEFRLESKDGVVPTKIEYEYDILDTLI